MWTRFPQNPMPAKVCLHPTSNQFLQAHGNLKVLRILIVDVGTVLAPLADQPVLMCCKLYNVEACGKYSISCRRNSVQ